MYEKGVTSELIFLQNSQKIWMKFSVLILFHFQYIIVVQ